MSTSKNRFPKTTFAESIEGNEEKARYAGFDSRKGMAPAARDLQILDRIDRMFKMFFFYVFVLYFFYPVDPVDPVQI